MVEALRPIHHRPLGRFTYTVKLHPEKSLFGFKQYTVLLNRENSIMHYGGEVVTGLERAHKWGVRECERLQRGIDERVAFGKSGLGNPRD